MTIALAVISIAVAVLGFLKVVHAISAGFTKIEMGQEELKSDFSELKVEMHDHRNEISEMKMDLVWVQASTGTPPRTKQ